jgi:hypothetical protein
MIDYIRNRSKFIMHTRLLVSFFLCLSVLSTKAQTQTLSYFDSLKNQKHTLKPTGDFDQRFSFINNKEVNIWGYRIGALVNDRYKVGIGFYTLKANFDSNITRLRRVTNISQVNQTLYYGTVYIEPYLIRRKRWEMSMIFELGYGNAIIDSVNIRNITGPRPSTSTKFTSRREPFIPVGMGLSFNLIIPDKKGFHFLTYLGLNGLVGIRRVILDGNFNENYNGLYWSIGTAIYIDRIFSDIKKKKDSKKIVE